ncbi:hypothetical protein [Streptomyces hypolithicus]
MTTGAGTSWAPPTATERLLHESAAREDGEGVIDALSHCRFYRLVARGRPSPRRRLGRVLRFDDEEHGSFYEQNVVAHRLLTENEGSPWRNMPWR